MDKFTAYGILFGMWIISMIHVYKAGVKYGAEKALDDEEDDDDEDEM